MTAPEPIRVAGDTNVGKVRTTNEDSMIVDPARGLYAVFDGMGGANAGDIASQMARDVVSGYLAQYAGGGHDPKALLDAALNAACGAINQAGTADRERHGMGTTAVVAIALDARRLLIGHVGDSRAYLLRHSRLQSLTRDHTIVDDLVQRGLLSAADAENHPYKNVLSRNLGSLPACKPDLLELELEPGDRLMLCSDGLYGYASQEAMQYILGSGDAPAHVAKDLVELALRGGGGDNVSTIVIEVPAATTAAASAAQVVRTNGAAVWWQRRQRFLQVCNDRGLTRNPICAGLGSAEALEVVGLSLCQAVYHDLEKSTGVNVWTFAQNIAGGWFERGGTWRAMRELIEILAGSAQVVVDEVGLADAQLGYLMEVAVTRALVVAELALGGLLAERLRQTDAEVIHLHNAIQEIERTEQAAIAAAAAMPAALPEPEPEPEPEPVDSGPHAVAHVAHADLAAAGHDHADQSARMAQLDREDLEDDLGDDIEELEADDLEDDDLAEPPPPRPAPTTAELAAQHADVLDDDLDDDEEDDVPLRDSGPVIDDSAPLLRDSAPLIDRDRTRAGRPPAARIDRGSQPRAGEHHSTIPFLRADRPSMRGGTLSAEMAEAIAHTITIARSQISGRATLVRHILESLEHIATDTDGSFGIAVVQAREIYGVRTVDDRGVMPLFDALDHARLVLTSSVHQIQAKEQLRARTLAVLSTAHQRLVGATTGLVLEAVAPISDRLREAQAQTSTLRDQVGRAERQRADLERRFATTVDPNAPWGARGNTNW